MSEVAIILILGTAAMLLMASFIVLFIFVYQKKVVQKELELRRTQQMLNDLEIAATYKFLEGQQKEQQRIAADLHDSIGSQLGVIGLQLNSLSASAQIDLQSMQDLVDNALQDVRGISRRLHQGLFLGNNLDDAILQIIQTISKSTNIKISYESHGLESNQSEELGREFFRIIQEFFSNTIKHAQASEINIDISYFKGDYCTLMFTDNGTGFDPKTRPEGIGLKTIRERVDRLNGQVYITSTLAKGSETVIEIRL